MAEPTGGQRRLILGLFAFAFLVFVGGVVVVAFLAGVI
jgi:hypothetical protein